MALSEAQRKVAESQHRFRTAIFGRRAGKTTLAIREMIRYASQPNRNIWYVAPSYRMAKEIAWRKISDILLDKNWVSKKLENSLTLYLKNGSIIELKGADNYDSLRGRSIDFLVLDEVADIHPEAFYSALMPALADRKGHFLACGTPKGVTNWAFDLYNNASIDDDWASWKVSTLAGGFVDEKEVEYAKQLLDEKTFATEFLADFVQSGSKIFYSFDREHNVKPYEGEDPRIVYIGQDFNVGFLTAVIFSLKDDVLHAVDEIVLTSSNTDEMVNEIKRRYGNKKIFVFPDPSAKANKTSSAGRTDISILNNAGFIVKAPNRHTPVRDTINAVNSMLLSASGQRRMFFDPRCKQTIESMDRWEYKEGSMIPDKNGAVDYSHLCDCVRYITDYLFPVKKQFTPQPEQRWGHKIGAI